MIRRSVNILKTNSFFLFGARGSGKSTLIRRSFPADSMLEIDLLDPATYEQASFALPELLARMTIAAHEGKWIFVDEVQKAPKLLDVAQSLIDKHNARMILTGSSARKLKRGAANLLAGRAFTYNLYPLTSRELGDDFDLLRYLGFGGLPRLWNTESTAERILFLRSYVTTYLKEEIAEEQVVRKLEPFGRFLQVAAQMSGKIINYTSIAKDVGASDQTIKTYFQILEDTLLGFTLPAFNESIRKAQGKSPKFYLFDPGVLRALRRTVDQPLSPANYEYGILFEHFVINEIRRRSEYAGRDFQFSFLRTADDQEIDLIIERPGMRRAVVEIKSSTRITEDDSKVTLRLGKEIRNTDLYLLSCDPQPKQFDLLTCLPWQDGVDAVIGANHSL